MNAPNGQPVQCNLPRTPNAGTTGKILITGGNGGSQVRLQVQTDSVSKADLNEVELDYNGVVYFKSAGNQTLVNTIAKLTVQATTPEIRFEGSVPWNIAAFDIKPRGGQDNMLLMWHDQLSSLLLSNLYTPSPVTLDGIAAWLMTFNNGPWSLTDSINCKGSSGAVTFSSGPPGGGQEAYPTFS
jgi:hypothetical protein